jgi:hypothetical protein
MKKSVIAAGSFLILAGVGFTHAYSANAKAVSVKLNMKKNLTLNADTDIPSVSLNGELDTQDETHPADGSYLEKYSVTAKKDDVLLIRMESEDFDTFLVVGKSDGEEIAGNDDFISEQDDLAHSQVLFKVPADGSYIILANSYEADEVGTYKLSVTKLKLSMEEGDRLVTRVPRTSPTTRSSEE